MVRFDPADPFDDETPAADPRGAGARRRAAAAVAPARRAALRAGQPAVGTGVSVLGAAADNEPPSAPTRASRRLSAPAPGSLCSTKFFALDPPFAGALRQRLALRAATACAALARHREDSSALRDAEHLSPNAGGNAPTSPAGRIHRLWRCFASPPSRLDAPTLRTAADLLGPFGRRQFRGVGRRLAATSSPAPKHPLAAAAGASAAAMKLFRERRRRRRCRAPAINPRRDFRAVAESDLALARRLGWDAPVPLLATAIAHASLRRGPSGKRPRPADPDWVDAAAGAYAMAAREAFALAGELSRRSRKTSRARSPNCGPRAPGASSNSCSSDDAISPARAAKAARLSDRAARRLFDRLIELGAARELSGRPNFRLYGL